MRYIFAIIITLLSSLVWAEDENFLLAKAPIDRSDMASVERGAKFFATTCMSCHTMVYLRYDKLAQKAGVAYDKMPINVKTWPYGVTPPDLSLEASIRGVDWIYTYLHSFYQDPSRPTGVNNLLVHNTAMPGIIVPYQGEQILSPHTTNATAMFSTPEWYDLVTQTKEGTMKPEQFDQVITDLVNFLAYAAEPYHAEQISLAPWVLGFLVILFVMMYFLKKEYWKDVKKYKKE